MSSTEDYKEYLRNLINLDFFDYDNPEIIVKNRNNGDLLQDYEKPIIEQLIEIKKSDGKGYLYCLELSGIEEEPNIKMSKELKEDLEKYFNIDTEMEMVRLVERMKYAHSSVFNKEIYVNLTDISMEWIQSFDRTSDFLEKYSR